MHDPQDAASTRPTDPSSADAAGAPSDRTTLTAVVDAYRSSGFTSDFFAEESTGATEREGEGGGASTVPAGAAAIRCATCASVLHPGAVSMHSIRRLEGASDPADMVAVVAATCPVCGATGTLVLSYGPMSSAVDADVFMAMRDRRDDDVLPASVAPGETDTTDP